MNEYTVSAVAGLNKHGGTENRGTGMIPTKIEKSGKLMATFNRGEQYLNGFQRDFFYVYKK